MYVILSMNAGDALRGFGSMKLSSAILGNFNDLSDSVCWFASGLLCTVVLGCCFECSVDVLFSLILVHLVCYKNSRQRGYMYLCAKGRIICAVFDKKPHNMCNDHHEDNSNDVVVAAIQNSMCPSLTLHFHLHPGNSASFALILLQHTSHILYGSLDTDVLLNCWLGSWGWARPTTIL